MMYRAIFTRGLMALGLSIGAGAGWAQDISLAERRTVTVNGQQKTIVSKLSKLNPNTTRARAVMDLNFTYGFHHQDGKPVIVNMLDRFKAQEGWDVTHYYLNDRNNQGKNDASKITLAELNKHLVVFANHISEFGSKAAEGIQPQIESYMEQTGGGMILLHGSGDTKNAFWTYYKEKLHPVNFQGHGNITRGTIFRPAEAAQHPVMEGGVLASEKAIDGEWHHFQKIITGENPKAEVLMKVDPARCNNCGYTGSLAFSGGNPISWVMPVGKGMVGYFQEGHDTKTATELTQAVWDRFFKQMIYYVAGYDTISTVGVVPDYARSHSGISFDEKAMAVFIEKPDYHKVGLYDLEGRKFDEAAGRGVAEYNFEATRSKLKTGVYIMRVDYGSTGTVTKRYVIRN